MGQSVELVLEYDSKEKFKSILTKSGKELTSLVVKNSENLNTWYSYGRIPGQSEEQRNKPNFKIKNVISHLPEMNGLLNLENLSLRFLGLDSIPIGLEDSKHLRSLDLSYNYIDLRHEVSLIEKLESLEELYVFGLDVTQSTIRILESTNENLKIFYTQEQELNLLNKNTLSENVREKELQSLKKEVYDYYRPKPIGGFQKDNTTLDKSINIIASAIKQELDFQVILSDQTNSSSCYIIEIPIFDNTKDGIRQRRSLSILVSTISDCFTIYFETSYYFETYGRFNRVAKDVIHGENHVSSDSKKLYQEVVTIIQNELGNGFLKVNYRDLFETEINGITPIGEDPEYIDRQYSLFNFLFYSSIDINKVQILD